MSTAIGIGFSNDINPRKAAFSAAQHAIAEIPSKKADLIFLFSTIEYDLNPILPAIADICETNNIIGCSTAGIITSDNIQKQGIAILAIESNDIDFHMHSSSAINSLTAEKEGSSLAHVCMEGFPNEEIQTFLCFVDGLLQNKTPFIQGLQTKFGNTFPIIGAGSCDNLQFKQSFQVYKSSVLTECASGILLGGNCTIGNGSRHGWRPLGKPRFVTEVQNNLIKKIDNQPAALFLEKFFDTSIEQLFASDHIKASILYPLGLFIEGTPEFLLRNIIKIYQDGSILCHGSIALGSQIHIMLGNKDTCKSAAKIAALEAKEELMGKTPKFVLIFESISRLKLFGTFFNEELKEIRKVFGPDIPIIGMCSDGEICPLQINEGCKEPLSQNASVSILAIS